MHFLWSLPIIKFYERVIFVKRGARVSDGISRERRADFAGTEGPGVSSITQSAAKRSRSLVTIGGPMRGRWERKVHAHTWVGVTACTKGICMYLACGVSSESRRLQSTCRRPGPIRYQTLGTHGVGGYVRTLFHTLCSDAHYAREPVRIELYSKAPRLVPFSGASEQCINNWDLKAHVSESDPDCPFAIWIVSLRYVSLLLPLSLAPRLWRLVEVRASRNHSI